MIVEIDGLKIQSEENFHDEIAKALKFGPFYGRNLDALWDTLSRDAERPIILIWNNSNHSKRYMSNSFSRIVNILNDVERDDEKFDPDEKFQFYLR